MSFSLSWSYGGAAKRSLIMPKTTRRVFAASASSLLIPFGSSAFDGGVGGLGKTRPQTGVVFRDEEAAASTTQSSTGDVTYEVRTVEVCIITIVDPRTKYYLFSTGSFWRLMEVLLLSVLVHHGLYYRLLLALNVEMLVVDLNQLLSK